MDITAFDPADDELGDDVEAHGLEGDDTDEAGPWNITTCGTCL